MLIDEAGPAECRRRHADLEVVAPGRVHDLGPGPRDAGLDTTAHLLGAHHSSVATCRRDIGVSAVRERVASRRRRDQVQLSGGMSVLS